MIVPALVFLAALTPPVAPHPLVGTWKINYPWHIEVENGVPKPTIESGRMTVVATGDSLVATILTDPSPMFPNRRPLRLAAVAGTGPVSFEMRGQVTVSGPTGNRTMTDVVTWIFNPSADTLTGSLERRILGEGRSQGHGQMPLSGTRVQ